jgi:hypothetical protein
MFLSVLFIIVPNWKPPVCSCASEWVSKMWCIHVIAFYSLIKGTIDTCSNWMNLSSIILSERSQILMALYFEISFTKL